MKQFIPARGRKHCWRSPGCSFGCETIHPRKGTETITHSHVFPSLCETIHPRKGTETTPHWSRGRGHTRNNSSPQGDGNQKSSPIRQMLMKQFIPARGRKRGAVGVAVVLTAKQFIPARGRKPENNPFRKNSHRNNSSPQGDGNFADTNHC